MDNKGKLAKKLNKMKNNLKEWGKELGECFNYTPTAAMALSYIQALMSQVERKNGWQLAEEILLFVEHWSQWRRKRQADAAHSHAKTR